MVNTVSRNEEIKYWLEVILKDDDLRNLSVSVLGNSEKGDGYIGDIVFVVAKGITEDNKEQVYDIVLKCSKKSQALRESAPIKESFMTEIVMYEQVQPYFLQFQKENSIENAFKSYPKCYGSLTRENMEVIALENMKSRGYELWPKKKPLTRKHINLVIIEYGKFHAISLALKQQRPNQYQKLVETLKVVSQKAQKPDFKTLFGPPINLACDLLKDDLDENVLKKWKGLEQQIDYIFTDLLQNHNGLKVINHGDCWNNNFMYLYDKKCKEAVPAEVAFLDWQISSENTPVSDLSYFLFTCLSKEDMERIEEILITYHQVLIKQLKQFGIKEAQTIYSYEQLLRDWKRFSRYGILICSLVMKMVSTEKDEVVDISEVAENGKEFA